MTELEKRVYNCWLATTRKNTGKPFRLRKNWDKFEDRPEYASVKKLAKLFMRYDNINIDEWFEAPYIIYTDKVQYDLKQYTLMKQFQTYRLYIQKKHNKTYTTQEFQKTLNKQTRNS